MTNVQLNIHTRNAKVHCRTITNGEFFTAKQVGEVVLHSDAVSSPAVCFKSGLGIHVLTGPAQGTTPAMYSDDKWVYEYTPIKFIRMEFSRD